MREYVPVAAVLGELAMKLRRRPTPDFIGLAGSGEPTLHSRLGKIIAGVKRLTNVPVAVLTNGSLLWRPEVRAGLAEADVVMPSLDVGSPQAFARVNRPHPDIAFARMFEGLLEFTAGFAGQVWLEVLVLQGITDQPGEIERIAVLVEQIRPARVQLNTVARPPTEREARAVPTAALEQIRRRLPGVSEVIAGALPAGPRDAVGGDLEAEVLGLVSRRPCTVAEIAAGLGVAPVEVLKHLEQLERSGAVSATRGQRGCFYHRRGVA